MRPRGSPPAGLCPCTPPGSRWPLRTPEDPILVSVLVSEVSLVKSSPCSLVLLKWRQKPFRCIPAGLAFPHAYFCSCNAKTCFCKEEVHLMMAPAALSWGDSTVVSAPSSSMDVCLILRNIIQHKILQVSSIQNKRSFMYICIIFICSFFLLSIALIWPSRLTGR